ncbi:MAG TPA: ABC transporter ATP-binding protein [Burkholderiaceae bacterium]
MKAVEGLSLTLPRGQVLGLLGPNGSGKSTALNLISGVLKPDRGSVKLGGREVAGQPSFELARRGVARTFQLVKTFVNMTARENVAAGMAFAGPRRFGASARQGVEDLLARVGLSERADTVASKLTYIDQKRLELARALASQPQVLLLDEWLAGLNPTELQDAIGLLKSVRADGVSILMVEHVLDAVRSLCDRCVVMNAGMPLAEGTPNEVLTHPEVVRAYLGSEDA